MHNLFNMLVLLFNMKPFIVLRYYPQNNINRASLKLDKGFKYLRDYTNIYDYEAYYIKGIKRFLVFINYLDNKRGKYTLNLEIGKRSRYKYGIDIYTGSTNFYKTNKIYSESLKFNILSIYRFVTDLSTNEIFIDSDYQKKLINNTNLDIRYKFMALAGIDKLLGTSYIPQDVFNKNEVLKHLISNYADVDISDILFYAYFMSYEKFKINGKYNNLKDDINYLKYSNKNYFVVIYPLEYSYRIDFLLQFKGRRAAYINGDKTLFNKIVNDKSYIEFKMAYPNYVIEDYVLIPEDLAHNVFILYDIKHNNSVRFMVY